jgi:hypothetical protein
MSTYCRESHIVALTEQAPTRPYFPIRIPIKLKFSSNGIVQNHDLSGTTVSFSIWHKAWRDLKPLFRLFILVLVTLFGFACYSSIST